MSWSTSELRVRLVPLNRLKPCSKIFYWPFQGGYFFCGYFMFFLSWVCYAFVHVCLYVLCGHLLGKGWPLGSSLWSLTVSLSLSQWYPGSGVVLDCIDSWPLLSYLLSTVFVASVIVHLPFWGQNFTQFRFSALFLNHQLGLVARKPVFGVSDKASFNPISSATQTS